MDLVVVWIVMADMCWRCDVGWFKWAIAKTKAIQSLNNKESQCCQTIGFTTSGQPSWNTQFWPEHPLHWRALSRHCWHWTLIALGSSYDVTDRHINTPLAHWGLISAWYSPTDYFVYVLWGLISALRVAHRHTVMTPRLQIKGCLGAPKLFWSRCGVVIQKWACPQNFSAR